MALDEDHHRLFVGLRSPAKLVVYDTESGKSVSALDLGQDADDIFYDQVRLQVYVSCGEGFLEVFKQIDNDHYQLVDKIQTVPGARTAFFSSETSQLFLAVPRQGSQAAAIRIYKVS
jgi:hypothetical protein